MQRGFRLFFWCCLLLFVCVLNCHCLCLLPIGDEAKALDPPMYTATASVGEGATDADVAMTATAEIPLDKPDALNRYF